MSTTVLSPPRLKFNWIVSLIDSVLVASTDSVCCSFLFRHSQPPPSIYGRLLLAWKEAGSVTDVVAALQQRSDTTVELQHRQSRRRDKSVSVQLH